MALPDLLQVFDRDTDAEVRVIADAGAAEAAKITADAELARGERVTAATAAFAAERRAAAEVELAAAQQRARAAVLAARAVMLERLRDAVAAELPAQLPRIGDTLVAAALACAGGEAGVLRCAPALAGAAVPAEIRVEADLAIATGAVLELASGTRIDATLASLLAREWPRLACEAVERIR